MKWAKSLQLEPTDSIETRIKDIFLKICSEFGNPKCIINKIDATGKIGGKLTDRINNGEIIQTLIKELIPLLEEEGQILELDLSILIDGTYEMLVTDGQHIDVLGEKDEIQSFLGANKDLDSNLF